MPPPVTDVCPFTITMPGGYHAIHPTSQLRSSPKLAPRFGWWQGPRISAKPRLPSHQLSQKLESIVVLKTTAYAPSRRCATRRTKEVASMRRIILLGTVALLMVAMLVGPGPASATAGCQDFGQLTAGEAQLETGVGEEVSDAAPANDDVNRLKAVCPLAR